MKTKKHGNGLDKECEKYTKAKDNLDSALRLFDVKFKDVYDRLVSDDEEIRRLTRIE